MTSIVELRDVHRTYRMGKHNSVHALKGVNLKIEPGEFVCIVGQSGSGKSTLLNLIGMLDRPTEGEVWVNGDPTAKMSEKQRALKRRNELGFIFQSFNLLMHLSAEENVSMPLRYMDPSRVTSTPRDLLTDVGLGERLVNRPDELSGGEQQRVAIARALVGNPALILADEPTGDLDSQTSEEIIRILKDLSVRGTSIVVVTHNAELADAATRLVQMKDGEIISDEVLGRAARKEALASTTRKATRRKPAAKKASAKKKAPARKPASKKSTARKPASKKSTAKKSGARKK